MNYAHELSAMEETSCIHVCRGTSVVAAAAPVSPQEATFRNAVEAVAPWGLDAKQLTNYLEEHWVASDDDTAEQAKRRDLLKVLVNTNGVELLTKCTIETETMPWAKISQTKYGKHIRDLERAEDLFGLVARVAVREAEDHDFAAAHYGIQHDLSHG